LIAARIAVALGLLGSLQAPALSQSFKPYTHAKEVNSVYVCPNKKYVKKDAIWGYMLEWYPHPSLDNDNIYKIRPHGGFGIRPTKIQYYPKSIDSAILISKGSQKLDDKMLPEIKAKLLTNYASGNLPDSAYKAVNIQVYKNPKHHGYFALQTNYRNANGDEMSALQAQYPETIKLRDKKGKEHDVFNRRHMGMLLCDDNILYVTTVSELKLNDFRNAYGERTDPPLIIWLQAYGLELMEPSSGSNFDF